jgi:hypothetical protein
MCSGQQQEAIILTVLLSKLHLAMLVDLLARLLPFIPRVLDLS